MTTFKRDTTYEISIERLQQKLEAKLEEFSKRDCWSENDYFAVERILQLLIESFIGFSRYYVQIVYQNKIFQTRDALEVLLEKKIITPSQYQTTLRILGFRNILVHDYLEINPAIVSAVVKKSNYGLLIQLTHQFVDNLNQNKC